LNHLQIRWKARSRVAGGICPERWGGRVNHRWRHEKQHSTGTPAERGARNRGSQKRGNKGGGKKKLSASRKRAEYKGAKKKNRTGPGGPPKSDTIEEVRPGKTSISQKVRRNDRKKRGKRGNSKVVWSSPYHGQARARTWPFGRVTDAKEGQGVSATRR